MRKNTKAKWWWGKQKMTIWFAEIDMMHKFVEAFQAMSRKVDLHLSPKENKT